MHDYACNCLLLFVCMLFNLLVFVVVVFIFFVFFFFFFFFFFSFMLFTRQPPTQLIQIKQNPSSHLTFIHETINQRTKRKA